jgi:hypothetical protein
MDFDEYFARHGEPHPDDYYRWGYYDPPEQEPEPQPMPDEISVDVLRELKKRVGGINKQKVFERLGNWPCDIVEAIDCALEAIAAREERAQ